MDFTLANLKVDAGQGFDFPERHVNAFQIQQDIALIQCVRFDQFSRPPFS
jgi:hypothetical protein